MAPAQLCTGQCLRTGASGPPDTPALRLPHVRCLSKVTGQLSKVGEMGSGPSGEPGITARLRNWARLAQVREGTRPWPGDWLVHVTWAPSDAAGGQEGQGASARGATGSQGPPPAGHQGGHGGERGLRGSWFRAIPPFLPCLQLGPRRGSPCCLDPNSPRFSHRKRTWPSLHLALVSWAKTCPLPSPSRYKICKSHVLVIDMINPLPPLLGR